MSLHIIVVFVVVVVVHVGVADVLAKCQRRQVHLI